jgi:spore coat protein U-like protein
MALQAASPRFLARRSRQAAAMLVMALPLAAAAGTATMGVTATVTTKNNCTFNSAIPGLTFAQIDPSGTADAVATTSVTFTCRGSSANATFVFSSNDGSYKLGAGAPRMRHSTNTSEYLRYSLAFSPASATVPKNVAQTVTITGTIPATYYANAMAGSYSDTVTISLNP